MDRSAAQRPVPSGIVDTHTHVSCTGDRSPDAPVVDASDWWRSGGSIDELLGDLDTAGVERAVVVQAVGAYGYDCSCAAASVVAHRDRTALVVAVDMNDDPAGDLATLLDSPPSAVSIAGVRAFGVGSVDDSWLTDGRGAALCALAAERGLVVVPCILGDRFDDLRALVERTPGIVVAVDHCGFGDMCVGDADDNLARLTDLPGVHLKVTSYVLEAALAADGDAAPTLERLVDRFGAHRLCWGSDHPQDRRHDYAGKLALARHAARALDDASRNALFDTTGRRLFFD